MTTSVQDHSSTTPQVDHAGWRSALVPPDRGERVFRWSVAAAMLLGLAIRVAFVLVKQSRLTLTTGDAFWYHRQAQLVADGRGFLNPFLLQYQGVVAPGADHPPGFVLVLAALDLLGISSPQGQRLAMCVLGTVSIGLIALLGRRLGGVWVGVVAAFLAACYPNIWINDGMLMVETVYIFAVAVSLLATYRYLDHHRLGDLALLSGSLTLAALVRPEALALFVVMVVPLVLTRRGLRWPERFGQLVVAAVIPLVAFVPWVAYNLDRFEGTVLISTGAGQTLKAGNCEYTYSGTSVGYYSLRCIQPPVITVTGDPSERDRQYQRSALDFMSDHTRELPRVMALRVARTWHVFRPIQSLDLDGWVEGRAGGPPSGDKSLVTAALLSYAALLPLAIAGGVVLWRRRIQVWPLLVQPALVSVIAALTFGITRYRAGAEITLVVLAAVSIVGLARLLRGRRDAKDAAARAGTGTMEGNGVDVEVE